ncbi:unnamed protein product [Nippostrongylus brasiliensis]|uniref:Uncharacterized protein n=1 Tax=Nippostrongylus brasiliensis TaxID=27835 RepID=A0A0N4YY57_NIPBR|nr:unnamed protein product [Nippostrongylus brasiliensis]
MVNWLKKKGIETKSDVNDFFALVERDENIIADICTALKTDVLQVRDVVAEIQSLQDKEFARPRSSSTDDEAMEAEGNDEWVTRQEMREPVENDYHQVNMMRRDLRTTLETRPIGGACGQLSRQHSELSEKNEQPKEAGQDYMKNLLVYLQASACPDPGKFRGKAREDFKEFLRRFRRKYGSLGLTDKALLEILGDDHLEERAKNVFLAIPEEVVHLGFEAVVREMERALASDSTAARMRAMTELKNLKLRPNQTIAEFCVALEKLARKANPESNIADRSLEYANIVFDNVRRWPEHVQLLSLLHKTDPRKAYSEIKQLAIMIENSREAYGPEQGRELVVNDWKTRAKTYKLNRGVDTFEVGKEREEHYRRRTLESNEDEGPQINVLGITYPQQIKTKCQKYYDKPEPWAFPPMRGTVERNWSVRSR